METGTILIIISNLFILLSSLFEVKAILEGKARPHRTTYLVLSLITALATASLFAQQDKVALWLAVASTLQCLVTFGLSIKYGMGGWGKIDIVCLIIALLGIVLWQTTKNPIVALYASILADFTGMIPALVKTFLFPETEIWAYYGFNVIAGLCTVLAIREVSLQSVSYPLYILVINLVMVVIIRRKQLGIKI